MKQFTAIIAAIMFWFGKSKYWMLQKAKDKHTLLHAVEQHAALDHQVTRFRFCLEKQIKAKKQLADHDREVSLAHERWCRYVGPPNFNRSEQALAA